MSANLNAAAAYSSTTYSPTYHATLLLIGRLLIAALFIVFGYMKLMSFGGTVNYFAKWGFPLPQATTVVSIIFELGFGALLAIGWKTRWWAWALAVYVVIAAAVAHRYWTYDPAQVFAQTSFFYKNLAVVGGLLVLAAVGPGRYSVDKA
jgi:putative oxidoreductase